MKCNVITNNEMLLDKENLSAFKINEVIYMDTLEITDVLKKVRDYVHKGYKILTHPLSGSVKPGETPFKSVAITVESGAIHMESLLIIEDAIMMSEKFNRSTKGSPKIPSEILDDFRLIDFGLIKSGLEGINNF